LRRAIELHAQTPPGGFVAIADAQGIGLDDEQGVFGLIGEAVETREPLLLQGHLPCQRGALDGAAHGPQQTVFVDAALHQVVSCTAAQGLDANGGVFLARQHDHRWASA